MSRLPRCREQQREAPFTPSTRSCPAAIPPYQSEQLSQGRALGSKRRRCTLVYGEEPPPSPVTLPLRARRKPTAQAAGAVIARSTSDLRACEKLSSAVSQQYPLSGANFAGGRLTARSVNLPGSRLILLNTTVAGNLPRNCLYPLRHTYLTRFFYCRFKTPPKGCSQGVR
jgi:hypothetical protein